MLHFLISVPHTTQWTDEYYGDVVETAAYQPTQF